MSRSTLSLISLRLVVFSLSQSPSLYPLAIHLSPLTFYFHLSPLSQSLFPFCLHLYLITLLYLSSLSDPISSSVQIAPSFLPSPVSSLHVSLLLCHHFSSLWREAAREPSREGCRLCRNARRDAATARGAVATPTPEKTNRSLLASTCLYCPEPASLRAFLRSPNVSVLSQNRRDNDRHASVTPVTSLISRPCSASPVASQVTLLCMPPQIRSSWKTHLTFLGLFAPQNLQYASSSAGRCFSRQLETMERSDMPQLLTPSAGDQESYKIERQMCPFE